ncbi:MAG: peptidyl-prolyl cis-trans isomerase [Candidatus Poribacteria bacterium]|nr:peptidyl-prolyl cis-trans isomerase [Candidatus Poribacteria bacterium]
MKKILCVVAVVFTACLLTWSLVSSDNHESSEGEVDKSQIIIAEYKWNGELHQISLADLEADIAELPTYRQRNYATKEGKAEYLEDYIDKRLKLLQATEEGFDKLQDHLDKLEDYTHQLMVEKLTEIEVDLKVSYTDEDLQGYYKAHMSEYIEDATVRATCITLDDEDLAYETLDQIKAGTDIVEAAKKLTEDKKFANGPGMSQDDPGNTGFFRKNASPSWSEFIDAVFEMENGEMTDSVFETDVDDVTYYLIFRKEEQKPERQKDFEEVKSDVERKVERTAKRERIIEWVDEITAKAKLKTYPENIPEPVQPETPEEESETSDK